MSDNTIKLVLEGRDEGGHVDLALLLQGLDALKSALQAADRKVHSGQASGLRYLISDLSHSSPAAVTILAKHAGGEAQADSAVAVVGCLAQAVEQVAGSGIPEDADYDVIRHLRPLCEAGRGQCRQVQLDLGGKSFRMTEHSAETFAQAFREEEGNELGSITGVLEQINIHGASKVFTIYPAVGPKKVSCAFPDRLLPEAVGNLGRRVEVHGLIKYRPHADFAHAVVVHDIEALPDDDTLPTFAAMRGILGKSEKSAAELIRDVRDEWD